MKRSPQTPEKSTDDVRMREVCELMTRLDPEPSHVLHVTGLALEIFDQLLALHQLGQADRFILEAAARLHDIGWSAAPSGKRHHKESARLIREHSWKSIPPTEIELIALVARYHRRSLPSPEHDDFNRLSGADQIRVEKLAAILRVGDALDHSHLQRVRVIECRTTTDTIEFVVDAKVFPWPEIEAAQKKSDLAARIYARRIAFALLPSGPNARSIRKPGLSPPPRD